MTLYGKAKEAGLRIGSHESDLYIEVSPESRELVAASVKAGEYCDVSIFWSELAGDVLVQWFDIPFAYQPFWTAKRG